MSAQLTLTDAEMKLLQSGLDALKEYCLPDPLFDSVEAKLKKGLDRPSRRRKRE